MADIKHVPNDARVDLSRRRIRPLAARMNAHSGFAGECACELIRDVTRECLSGSSTAHFPPASFWVWQY